MVGEAEAEIEAAGIAVAQAAHKALSSASNRQRKRVEMVDNAALFPLICKTFPIVSVVTTPFQANVNKDVSAVVIIGDSSNLTSPKVFHFC